MCEAALPAAIKGGNFGAKLTHLWGFWLDVLFFSHVKKHRSRFWLDVSFFFTCESHRSLLWLARTNMRTKIYEIAFWWVFLSMYMINYVTITYFKFTTMKKASWNKWLPPPPSSHVSGYFWIRNRSSGFKISTSTRIHIQIELARPHVCDTYPDAL